MMSLVVSCSAWDGIRQASDLHAELQTMSSKLDAITTEQQANMTEQKANMTEQKANMTEQKANISKLDSKLDSAIQTGLSLIQSLQLAAIQSAVSPTAPKP